MTFLEVRNRVSHPSPDGLLKAEKARRWSCPCA